MIKENQSELKRANLIKYQKMPKKNDLWYVVLDDTSKPRNFDKITIIDDFKRYFRTSDSADHNTNVCGVVRELTKDAKIITFPFFNNDAQEKIIEWIIDNQAKIAVVSLSATLTRPSAEAFKQLEATDIPILCASGNNYNDKPNSTAVLTWTIACGSYEDYHDRVPAYSNGGVDIVAFSNIYIYTGKDSFGKNRYKLFNGTSCATPFAGSALWLYMSRMNVKLNRQEVFDFIKNNTLDILEKGHDAKSGYGLFILPEKTKVNLFIGSDKYLIDGVTYRMDTAPVLKSKRTFVPIRFVAEALGFKVTWGGDVAGGNKKEVIIQNGNLKVNMLIGSSDYLVNNNKSKMDVKPFLQNNRTYVPIRFVAEALGAKVTWSGDIGGNRNEVIIEKEGE